MNWLGCFSARLLAIALLIFSLLRISRRIIAIDSICYTVASVHWPIIPDNRRPISNVSSKLKISRILIKDLRLTFDVSLLRRTQSVIWHSLYRIFYIILISRQNFLELYPFLPLLCSHVSSRSLILIFP